LCTLFTFFSSEFLRTTWRIKYCRLGDVEFVVCRDDSGNVRAFYNVCRHHASILASGSGQKSCFVCPYHVSLITSLNMHTGIILILFFYGYSPFLCYDPCEVEETIVKLSFMDNGCYHDLFFYYFWFLAIFTCFLFWKLQCKKTIISAGLDIWIKWKSS